MTATIEVLARHGVRITDEELAAELAAALDRDAAESGTLSAAEISFLTEHAGADAARTLEAFDPDDAHRRQVLATTDATVRLLQGLLTRAEAAVQLGIDETGVSRRIADGRLWALGRRGRRIPAWQIHTGALLPGLEQVIAAIPDGADPATVQGLMTTPQDDLDGASPIEHLAAGGNPVIVAEMVAELNLW